MQFRQSNPISSFDLTHLQLKKPEDLLEHNGNRNEDGGGGGNSTDLPMLSIEALQLPPSISTTFILYTFTYFIYAPAFC